MYSPSNKSTVGTKNPVFAIEKIVIGFTTNDFTQFNQGITELASASTANSSIGINLLSTAKANKDHTLLQAALAAEHPLTEEQKKIFSLLFRTLGKDYLITTDINQDYLKYACKEGKKDLILLLLPYYHQAAFIARKIQPDILERIINAISETTDPEIIKLFTPTNDLFGSPAWTKEAEGQLSAATQIKNAINAINAIFEKKYKPIIELFIQPHTTKEAFTKAVAAYAASQNESIPTALSKITIDGEPLLVYAAKNGVYPENTNNGVNKDILKFVFEQLKIVDEGRLIISQFRNITRQDIHLSFAPTQEKIPYSAGSKNIKEENSAGIFAPYLSPEAPQNGTQSVAQVDEICKDNEGSTYLNKSPLPGYTGFERKGYDSQHLGNYLPVANLDHSISNKKLPPLSSKELGCIVGGVISFITTALVLSLESDNAAELFWEELFHQREGSAQNHHNDIKALGIGLSLMTLGMTMLGTGMGALSSKISSLPIETKKRMAMSALVGTLATLVCFAVMLNVGYTEGVREHHVHNNMNSFADFLWSNGENSSADNHSYTSTMFSLFGVAITLGSAAICAGVGAATSKNKVVK